MYIVHTFLHTNNTIESSIFNSTALLPPSTRNIIFESPNKRASFINYWVDRWYTGPTLEHCRNHRKYCSKTRKVDVDVIINLSPSHCEMHTYLLSICLRKTIYLTQDLSNTLLSILCALYSDDSLRVLQQFKNIFTTLIPHKSTPPKSTFPKINQSLS